MNALKFGLDAFVGFAFGSSTVPLERKDLDIEIARYLTLALKDTDISYEKTARNLEGLHDKLKKLSFSIPICLSGIYSLIGGLGTQNPQLTIESLGTTLPFALLGRFVGNTVEKYKNRKKYAELSLLRDYVEGRRGIETLVAPEEYQAVRRFSEQIEGEILKEGELDKQKLEECSFEMYKAIVQNPKIYTPLVLKWSLDVVSDRINRAKTQKKFMDFYEDSIPHGSNCFSSTFYGEGGKTNIRVYAREGKTFSIESVEFGDIKIVEVDGKGMSIRGAPSKTNSVERFDWTGDYRMLAERGERDKQNGIVLLNSNGEISRQAREIAILAAFSDSYRDYLKEKEDELTK